MLQPNLITETAEQLKSRIEQRFPSSGLAGVAAQIAGESSHTAENIKRLSRPVWWLRLTNAILLGGIGSIAVYVATHMSMRLRLNDMERFIQFLEPRLGKHGVYRRWRAFDLEFRGTMETSARPACAAQAAFVGARH